MSQEQREFEVVVPVEGSPLSSVIAPKSGCVVRRGAKGTLVDYEGNLPGAMNIRTFADRVAHAAGRAATSYPTIARSLAQPEHLVLVGWFDSERGQIWVEDEAALAAWLGLKSVPEEELLTTDGRSQLRRDLERLDRHMPQQARQIRRRLGLEQ